MRVAARGEERARTGWATRRLVALRQLVAEAHTGGARRFILERLTAIGGDLEITRAEGRLEQRDGRPWGRARFRLDLHLKLRPGAPEALTALAALAPHFKGLAGVEGVRLRCDGHLDRPRCRPETP